MCQAIDKVCSTPQANAAATVPATPPIIPAEAAQSNPSSSYFTPSDTFNKGFCVIRPPGHHCGEDLPSGFCYVNNVVVGALHGYLEHDIDRAIIIDFDLHHGMPIHLQRCLAKHD